MFFGPDGRKYVKTGTYGSKIYWDGPMLFHLKKYYPCSPNDEVAELCGVSPRTVVRKARELGLVKDAGYEREKTKRGIMSMQAHNKKHGNSGQFAQGHHGGKMFEKGMIPMTARKTMRLDTNEVYETAKACGEALGRSGGAVVQACRRYGKCAGVAVRYVDVTVGKRRRAMQIKIC